MHLFAASSLEMKTSRKNMLLVSVSKLAAKIYAYAYTTSLEMETVVANTMLLISVSKLAAKIYAYAYTTSLEMETSSK
jgi:hypothetical protein